MPNATKALREEMQTHPSDKFLGINCDALTLGGMAVILVAESDHAMAKVSNAMMADSNIVGVSRQVADHPLFTTKGWLGINNPL